MSKQPPRPASAKGKASREKGEDGLTAQQRLFVAEYGKDQNATQAAIRAGYAPETARQQGSRLLTNAVIKRMVNSQQDEIIQAIQIQTGISAAAALTEAWNIVIADARELVEHYVGCCRHCYGEGFRFQRTVGERNREFEDWETKGKGEWDEKGGIGFDPRKPPNPHCPDCAGAGHGRTVVKDTRSLSAAARALYAGVKQTMEGIEVKMHSKLDALEKVFKHLGLYKQDNEQKKPELAEQIGAFVSQLHSSGAGRLQIAKRPQP